MSNNMIWPPFFPPDCPPSDAIDASGVVVYRFVKNNPPLPSDFVTYKEKQPNKDFGNQSCQASGHSVYIEEQDALWAHKSVPGMRKKMIAKAYLTAQHGKLKHTPSGHIQSHYTWWVPMNIQPWQLFTVIKLT